MTDIPRDPAWETGGPTGGDVTASAEPAGGLLPTKVPDPEPAPPAAPARRGPTVTPLRYWTERELTGHLKRVQRRYPRRRLRLSRQVW
ncbi:hypothetical protein LX16_1499 [Stackebrandtia albiflava]|uniref:Uncharacterized protein n=1 Tax=Stackebrandtia albiflava TaxID=406432 RepID=A0A562VD49_9ACTN|nr:hypothetical protein [Stackebrandtia albiflava]TWJ15785.1 hypothetical protein LX16_1499 [Stackebrandtia albiflava]